MIEKKNAYSQTSAYWRKTPVATSVRLAGERVRIEARLRFTRDCDRDFFGLSIKQRVLDELNRQFSHDNPFFREMIGNEYDFPELMGKRIKVSRKFTVVDTPPYVCFHVVYSRGVCGVPFFPWWRAQGNKHILLFIGDMRTKYDYSPMQLEKVAVHEFGHALGIGDLYGGWAPYGFCYRTAAAITPEMPANDIMRTHFRENDFMTPNDLEMALIAHQTNSPQTHVPTGRWKGLNHVSSAVRLKNV